MVDLPLVGGAAIESGIAGGQRARGIAGGKNAAAVDGEAADAATAPEGRATGYRGLVAGGDRAVDPERAGRNVGRAGVGVGPGENPGAGAGFLQSSARAGTVEVIRNLGGQGVARGAGTGQR